MNKKIISIAVVAIVAVGVGAFYCGGAYQNKKIEAQKGERTNSFQSGVGGQQRPQGGQKMGSGQGQGGFSGGEIISKDEKSITIKGQDGGSEIVYFSETTQISKSAEGSFDDLMVGQQLMVAGKTNSDGSLAAENIQIRPIRSENK